MIFIYTIGKNKLERNLHIKKKFVADSFPFRNEENTTNSNKKKKN